LVIEHILKVKPCALCIYQRYPYYLILLLSALFFLKNNWKYSLMILMTLTSIVGFFLAGYHVGIEYGLINELSSCKTEISKNMSKDILLKELQSKLAPSCKVVEFKLFGLSLASINMIMSLILTILYYKIFRYKLQ
jgi:disulfide bond formation protein DsbB